VLCVKCYVIFELDETIVEAKMVPTVAYRMPVILKRAYGQEVVKFVGNALEIKTRRV